MKENRLAQNNEILHKSRHFQRIPHYNVEKLSYAKIQLSSIRINRVPHGLLPCQYITKRAKFVKKAYFRKLQKQQRL
ncbi:hypothetical protein T12_7928 [Trichinella patagoniensis]|uniref:Uncharacterized protein n=1 Tax=Trichinella patagoniensis TaxID=990121 RepID=A0A0V0YUQ8_9BILA|nr:hypothetical protein T12_7928 [Trichinella patagoniensis]